LIAGITQVANEKGLDREVIFEAIEAALISAYKRNYGSVANVTAEVDRVTGEMNILAEREVVEDVISERTEIAEKEAKKINPNAELGDVIQVKTNPDDFGRIAAQTAKQVILQRIREAERDTVYENFARVERLPPYEVIYHGEPIRKIHILRGHKFDPCSPKRLGPRSLFYSDH